MAWTLFGSNWLTGIICMWHGLLVDIPNGWALCDGTQGTPDLRGRFVRAAYPDVDPGGTGGAASHSHVVSGNTGWFDTTHDHEFYGQTEQPKAGDDDVTDIDGDVMEYDTHEHPFGDWTLPEGGEHRHSFFDTSTVKANLPFYYDVAFIMKL